MQLYHIYSGPPPNLPQAPPNFMSFPFYFMELKESN